MSDKYDIKITPRVTAQVRVRWPKAQSIRPAGKCPDCKQAGLVSYQLPEDWDREVRDGMEHCGFYCVRCGWGNAGSRQIEIKSS